MHHRPHQNQSNLTEGLRSNDLEGLILDKFTIDQYKSKMGNDEDIIVLAFKVKDKYPCIDAMEFIEKNYESILDADMSTGEESDGKYSLFVEFERNSKFPEQLDKLLKGLERLCNCSDWRFKYFKDTETHQYTKDAIKQFVPLTPEEYQDRVKEQKMDDVSEILNQGTTEVIDVDENNNLVIGKPYSGNLELMLDDIGLYEDLVKKLAGPLQLDEASNGELLFLEKYLGSYEIHKIDNRFIIRNGNHAIIVRRKN